MSSEDPADEESAGSSESDATDETMADDTSGATTDDETDASDVRERLEQGADRAVESFDEGVVDLLSWVLETETRARIYVHLRKHPDSTSDEIAEGTGLYPSTVREALAEMHADGTVERDKRESDGAGNNPFEYRAIAPSALVREAVEDIQTSLNDVFQLDRYMGGEDTSDQEPVTITVEAEDEDADRDEDEDWGEPPGGDEESGVDEDETDESAEGEPGESAGVETDESADEAGDEDADEAGDADADEAQDEDIDESL